MITDMAAQYDHTFYGVPMAPYSYERALSDCDLHAYKNIKDFEIGSRPSGASDLIVQLERIVNRSGQTLTLSKKESTYHISTSQDERPSKDSDVRAVVKVLDEIKSVFGLTVKELAEVVMITPKTYYNWVKGSSRPRSDHLQRILTLSAIHKDWVYYGFPVDKISMFHEKVQGDQSVFDLLKSKKLDSERVLHAGTSLHLLSSKATLKDPFA